MGIIVEFLMVFKADYNIAIALSIPTEVLKKDFLQCGKLENQFSESDPKLYDSNVLRKERRIRTNDADVGHLSNYLSAMKQDNRGMLAVGKLETVREEIEFIL